MSTLPNVSFDDIQVEASYSGCEYQPLEVEGLASELAASSGDAVSACVDSKTDALVASKEQSCANPLAQYQMQVVATADQRIEALHALDQIQSQVKTLLQNECIVSAPEMLAFVSSTGLRAAAEVGKISGAYGAGTGVKGEIVGLASALFVDTITMVVDRLAKIGADKASSEAFRRAFWGENDFERIGCLWLSTQAYALGCPQVWVNAQVDSLESRRCDGASAFLYAEGGAPSAYSLLDEFGRIDDLLRANASSDSRNDAARDLFARLNSLPTLDPIEGKERTWFEILRGIRARITDPAALETALAAGTIRAGEIARLQERFVAPLDALLGAVIVYRDAAAAAGPGSTTEWQGRTFADVLDRGRALSEAGDSLLRTASLFRRQTEGRDPPVGFDLSVLPLDLRELLDLAWRVESAQTRGARVASQELREMAAIESAFLAKRANEAIEQELYGQNLSAFGAKAFASIARGFQGELRREFRADFGHPAVAYVEGILRGKSRGERFTDTEKSRLWQAIAPVARVCALMPGLFTYKGDDRHQGPIHLNEDLNDADYRRYCGSIECHMRFQDEGSRQSRVIRSEARVCRATFEYEEVMREIKADLGDADDRVCGVPFAQAFDEMTRSEAAGGAAGGRGEGAYPGPSVAQF